jgi:hypothetical protein
MQTPWNWNPERPYQCTFCSKNYKMRSEWKRHEADSHKIHPYEWICMLEHSFLHGRLCTFCGTDSPEDSHWEKLHSISECLNDGPAYTNRASLKYHVWEKHLTLFEQDVKDQFYVPDKWRREIDATRSEPASRWCGFCELSLVSTAARTEHVGNHFYRQDVDMSKWKPCPPS